MAKTPPGLDAYKWHSKLGSYGHTEESYTQEGEADESEVVVNALVTSVIVPRLEKLARETFDPMSRKQTTRALGLIEEVSYSVEKTSPRFEVSQDSLSDMTGRQTKLVDADSRPIVPIPPTIDRYPIPKSRRTPLISHFPPFKFFRSLHLRIAQQFLTETVQIPTKCGTMEKIC